MLPTTIGMEYLYQWKYALSLLSWTLSGLEKRKEIYKQAVETLSDSSLTRLILVGRPKNHPQRAARSSGELKQLGVENQLLIINGILQERDEKTK